MVEPPDLKAPFENDGERALALAELLQACTDLERLVYLAAESGYSDHAAKTWSSRVKHHSRSDELSQARLQRWAATFGEELRAVIDARNRAVHGLRLGDAELRGATWLAKRLLDLAVSSRPTV